MVVQKRRFILFEIIFDSAPRAGAISEEDIAKALKESLVSNWGWVGEAQGQMRLMYWSPAVHLGVVRCARVPVEQVRAALTLVQSIKGRPSQFRIHCCGGTLRVIQESAADLLRQWEQRARSRTTTDAQAISVASGFEAEARLFSEVSSNWLAVSGE